MQLQRLFLHVTRLTATLGPFLLLVACATPTSQHDLGISTPDRFTLSGRFTANYQKPDGSDDSVSGHFDWQQRGQQAHIDLRSPFGQTLAKLIIDEQAQLLVPDRAPLVAPDAETLTQQQLGWSLPVRGLRYWLLGQAQPDGPSHITPSESEPHIAQLNQNGWQIDYLSWHDNQPQRINLHWLNGNPKLELRLILDTWE